MHVIEQEFESLPMRKRELIKVGSNQYRVLDSKGQLKNVEANTAYEAFKLSELNDAIKIERLADLKPIIITQSEFIDKTPQAGEASDNLSEIMQTEAEQFEQSRKLMKTVISANDLDKIMQSRTMSEPIVAPAENASGTEVHGDGFDEIIPAASAQPAVKTTVAPAKEMPQVEIPQGTPEQPITPEQTLSPEEVEKLLNSNG